MASELIRKSPDYKQWLTELKQRFRHSQLKAAVAVNQQLLEFYWELGSDIAERQKQTDWGSGFLRKLSVDLQAEFPNMKGFSLRNLQQIRRWFLFWSGENTIAQQAAAQLTCIPWWHNVVIITKCETVAEATFYVQRVQANGWSRSVLTHQIESQLWQREGKALTNFQQTLPAPQSDLANQLIKDPYTFDFLALTQTFNERELEQGLVAHIQQFLLELGAGFAYLGKQVPITVGERDFFLDLLFYHTRLHCYVVVELKVVSFEPEHAGKLNFYLKAVDEQLRQPVDQPTIGILLCKDRDRMVAEYALSGIDKPIGVSEYQLTQSLPTNLQSSLPSIEEIEAELSREDLDE